MNQFFRRLPLRAKLFILTLVPLLFIVYLAVELYYEQSRNVAQLKGSLETINQSASISRLIDQLQKEGHYSFDFALTKSHQLEMMAQRPVTDSIFNELKNHHDESLKDFPAYTFLGQLDSVRVLISSNRYNADQVMRFYSGSIFRLNTLNKTSTLDNAILQDAYAEMTSQRLLSELITYQGIINANIYNILYTRKYVVEILLGTYGTHDVYKTYKKEFTTKASPKALEAFDSLHDKGAFHQVDTYLDQVFSTFKVDSTYSYLTWNALSEKSLNDLRSLQMRLLDGVERTINSYYHEEVAAKSRAIVYVIGITILLMLLVAYILSIINSSLNDLRQAALKLAGGATDINVTPFSKDAIGSLATSIGKVDEKNKELANAAHQIGMGNFDVPVKPRSREDQLGNAIVQMKENLLRYTSDLEKSREEFVKLAEFMPQIVWTTDRDGHNTYYNRKWYEITGAKKDYSEQSWIAVLHPDDVGPTLTTWYKSIETGEPYTMEYRFRDVSRNEYRWFLGRALPVKDGEGKIIKWFGTATDIHDQKLQNEKLEQLVAERTFELNRSNEDLQQFAHVASHDLKEPLRKIRTFSNLLAVEYGALIPEKGKTYMEKLQLSSERMSNMIDSILNYSVINATEQIEETVDLNAIIEGVKDDLELLILQKDAKIIHQTLPKIIGSQPLLYQLFYNLITNALKFSKANVPSKINIEAMLLDYNQVSDIKGMKKADRYVHITIRDNGIGFNQEYAEKMFNVFTRLNAKDKYEGTGLGLALCKKIVHRHHGTIYAKGEEGGGASFHIILPDGKRIRGYV